MKTIVSAAIIIILSFGLSFLPLPWYTPIIVSFIIGIAMYNLQPKAFLSGFLGVGLFWLIMCLGPYFDKSDTLTQRLSELFTDQLGFTVTPFILLLLTSFLGGLLGGLSMLSASLLMTKGSEGGNGQRGSRRSRSKSYKLKLG